MGLYERVIALLLGVVCLNLFAFVTIKLRPGIFGVKPYKPLLWNFRLSVLPLAILIVNIAVFTVLSTIGAYWDILFFSIAAYVLFFVGLVAWLLFLPNSGYLITELNLSHRINDTVEVPIWYDIVSILSFALSGIVNTMLNIVIIQVSVLVVLDPPELSARGYAGLFLSGFVLIFLIVLGIYLGRAIRFNTWDILHPVAAFKKLREHFAKTGVFKDFALYVLLNTVFFLIMYIAFGIPFYFM